MDRPNRWHPANPIWGECSARTRKRAGLERPAPLLLSHVPPRLCREFPYGLPGALPVAGEPPCRTGSCEPARWRAIGHSETLYRPPKPKEVRGAVGCLVRRGAWSGSKRCAVFRGVRASLLSTVLSRPAVPVSSGLRLSNRSRRLPGHWCGSRTSYAMWPCFSGEATIAAADAEV